LIYLDTSVALAHLFVEDRRPGEGLWEQMHVNRLSPSLAPLTINVSTVRVVGVPRPILRAAD